MKLSTFDFMRSINDVIHVCFIARMPSDKINAAIHEKIDRLNLTEKGNARYPQKTIHAVLSHALLELERMRNEKTIFCYDVDGTLYTTFNDKKRGTYYFTGETDIPNYRDNPEIEKLVMHSNYDSGFYYPCGRPFYVLKGVK